MEQFWGWMYLMLTSWTVCTANIVSDIHRERLLFEQTIREAVQEKSYIGTRKAQLAALNWKLSGTNGDAGETPRDRTAGLAEVNILDITVGDSGHGVNCGSKANKMDFSWTPKLLSPKSPLTITVDMLAAVDLASGSIILNVTDKAAPTTPIYAVTKNGACADFQKFGLKNLTCPVKAKDVIKTYLVAKDLSAIPKGTFIIMIVITNEKKQPFVCVKAEVTVQTE